MPKRRTLKPQEVETRRRFKASLRGLHEGPHGLPRKLVWMSIPVDEATYARWLSEDYPDLPGLLDLLCIINVARNPAPLAVLARRSGDGYELGAGAAAPAEFDEDPQLRSLEADTAVDVQLARDLKDRVLSPKEAQRLLPLLQEQGRVNQKNRELCERVLRSRRAVRVK